MHNLKIKQHFVREKAKLAKYKENLHAHFSSEFAAACEAQPLLQ
jgi:hypothetical protein